MFGNKYNIDKFKINLKLAVNRLKLLQKKKAEIAKKCWSEIAEHIASGKIEKARIRVEHIIREDYIVEAMEIVEMYCLLLQARIGVVTQLKELEEGIAEAVSSLIWVAPRMHTDVKELKVISDLLTTKYGKEYADACRSESVNTISEKLKHKLSIQTPPKILVEKYLIEIAKKYNVEYTPDEQVMREEQGQDALLLDFNGPPMPPGFIGYPQPPSMPTMPMPKAAPFNYPNMSSGSGGSGVHTSPGASGQSKSHPVPPDIDNKDLNNIFLQEEMGNLPPAYDSINYNSPPLAPSQQPMAPSQPPVAPTPQPRSKPSSTQHVFPDLPELPSVPSNLILPSVPHSNQSQTNVDQSDNPTAPDEIDFEDLNRRFEELKRKK